MKILRCLLAIALAVYMTGAGCLAFAQDADTSPFSITLAPVQFADVKGNVGKFEALNWMPNGENAGVSDISFVKDINKNISVEADGSVFPKTDDNTGHLILQDGDLAFLKVDYNAFRKYYDGTGGVYPYPVLSVPGNTHAPIVDYGNITDQGAQPNSPDLQMDVSFFKLEAGLGPVSDPFLDVSYQHNSKDGDKSLLEWTPVYASGQTNSESYRKIGPAWESVDDTVDTITLKEKKDLAGVTVTGQQKAEVDYNHDEAYLQYLSSTAGATSELSTYNESPDAKLFGAGIRAEKWMLNDNTYAGLGYHYNHIHDTDLMQTSTEPSASVTNGVITLNPAATTFSGWNYARASEDDHVWVGNLNTNLTPNLAFITDARYEHMGSEGYSYYYSSSTSPVVDTTDMENHEDQEGEHASFRYSGIPHTSLYAETDFEQERNWVNDTYAVSNTPASNYLLDRIDDTRNGSWTVGGRVVPNRFFIFSTQVKQFDNSDVYDTVATSGNLANADGVILMQSLKVKGVEEESTLQWKPYHWLQNSLRYQFSDTVYNPQLAPQQNAAADPLPADGAYNITENHMLTSAFTYDISVQPIDPLLLMFTYSHAENYVRTIGASSDGTFAEGGPTYMPVFNSGDNSFLLSASYAPTEDLVWTNTVCYTISSNYVDTAIGVPLGSDFRMTNFTTGLEWTFHKWLKIGPSYEYASYKDNPIAGDGTYSANIFELKLKFNW
jgi:hypothetical protein